MQKNNRIVYTTINGFSPYLADGVSRSMFELFYELKNEGFVVSIVSFLTNESSNKKFIKWHSDINSISYPRFESVDIQDVPVHQTILPYSDYQVKTDKLWEAVGIVAGELKARQADLVFTCDFSPIPVVSSWMGYISCIHYFHSPSAIHFWERNDHALKILSTRNLFSASKFIRDKVNDKLGLKSSILHPLWQIVTPQTDDLPQLRSVVGFYSAGKHKGDDIVWRLIYHMPEIEFIIVGRNFSYQTNKLPDNLLYLGDIEDMKDLYQRISVLLVPSLGLEGFPRVILEAAFYGIPTIANQIGGIPEAMGDSGILIDIDKIEQPDLEDITQKYVDAIQFLLQSDSIYNTYCQRSLGRARSFRKLQELREKSFLKCILTGRID